MKLTRQQYHHALALFIIARRKQQEVVALETEMNKILGDENMSHASDAIYSMFPRDEEGDFNEALQKMNVTWETQEEEQERIEKENK